MNKALFLDRDGIVNVDSGHVGKIEDFIFIDDIFTLCKYAVKQEFMLIIVTNQSGIGRGYYTEEDFHNLTTWMKKKFLEQNISITQVYFCPYHEIHGIGKYKKASLRRKPNPGMILDALADFNIDPKQSTLIGDKESDIEAALKAGIENTIIIDDGTNPTKAKYRFPSLKQLLSPNNLALVLAR